MQTLWEGCQDSVGFCPRRESKASSGSKHQPAGKIEKGRKGTKQIGWTDRFPAATELEEVEDK